MSLANAIEMGTVEEVLTIISRLQDFLPEYGRTRTDEKFAEHWKEVHELESKLANRRALMREEALRIIEKAQRQWTDKEIEEACGYSI